MASLIRVHTHARSQCLLICQLGLIHSLANSPLYLWSTTSRLCFQLLFFYSRSCFEGCQGYVDDGKEARDPVDKLLRIIIKMRGNELRGEDRAREEDWDIERGGWEKGSLLACTACESTALITSQMPLKAQEAGREKEAKHHGNTHLSITG